MKCHPGLLPEPSVDLNSFVNSDFELCNNQNLCRTCLPVYYPRRHRMNIRRSAYAKVLNTHPLSVQMCESVVPGQVVESILRMRPSQINAATAKNIHNVEIQG